jgi:hypothetical protein
MTDYVGHKRPPFARRFKKGQSGNPSGRPKGSKNAKALYVELANRKVRIRVGSKLKMVTQLEVVLQAMILKAMKGDTRAADTYHKIGKSLGAFDPAPPAEGTYGVIVVPATMTMEEWKKASAEHHAKFEEQDAKKAKRPE